MQLFACLNCLPVSTNIIRIQAHRVFWRNVGELVAPGGRLDFMCGSLGSHEECVSLMEKIAAASNRFVAGGRVTIGGPATGLTKVCTVLFV